MCVCVYIYIYIYIYSVFAHINICKSFKELEIDKNPGIYKNSLDGNFWIWVSSFPCILNKFHLKYNGMINAQINFS